MFFEKVEIRGLLKESRGTCGTSAKIPVILADVPHVLRSGPFRRWRWRWRWRCGDEDGNGDVEMKMEIWCTVGI